MLHAHLTGAVPWIVLAVLVFVLLWIDLRFFARGREPGFREAVDLVDRLARARASAMALVVCELTGLPRTPSPTRPST